MFIKRLILLFAVISSVALATVFYAGGNTSSVTASVTINNYCSFTTNVAGINFIVSGGPGTNTGTETNTIAVTNTGNLATNILVAGAGGGANNGNWIYASNSFYVTNTVWDYTASTAYASANPLTTTSTDTHIPVNTVSANTISFGLAIPAGQAPGTYSQTISIISTC